METCWQDPLSYVEGSKVSKPQGKESPPAQQTLRKKKTKKKKKKSGQEDAEKQSSKSKKQPVFLTSPELLHLCSNGTTEDDASKETAGRTTHQLFSTSNFSLLTKDNSDQSNESLRWNGILDDPVAEEERLWQYRLNRRKRYGAYIQQSLPPEPSLTLKHLPQFYKVAHLNSDHLFCKTELATSQNSKS